MRALSFTTRLCIGHVAVPNECGRQPRERRDDGSAIRATATKHAPWYVVPADNKWFTRMVVAAAIVKTLGSPGPHLSHARPGEAPGARRGEEDIARREVANGHSRGKPSA
jgi:Polyphosphate kinase 2 (PPK2)